MTDRSIEELRESVENECSPATHTLKLLERAEYLNADVVGTIFQLMKQSREEATIALDSVLETLEGTLRVMENTLGLQLKSLEERAHARARLKSRQIQERYELSARQIRLCAADPKKPFIERDGDSNFYYVDESDPTLAALRK